jgi:hypothetical protein
MGLNDPFKRRDDRCMIDDLAVSERLLAFFDGRQELLLIGNIGPQRLVDEPRLAAPRRRDQPFEIAVEIGSDAGGNDDGFGHGFLPLNKHRLHRITSLLGKQVERMRVSLPLREAEETLLRAFI